MKITKHCTEIEGDCKCCPVAVLAPAPSNVNKKKKSELLDGADETEQKW